MPFGAYDAVIIGGGHNGLVCAFYLARAGLKVRVLERRAIVGGAAVTEEFHPGFRNSAASYTVSLLQPKVVQDMGLACRGYRVIERPLSNFLPLNDSDYLCLGGGLERTQKEFRKFSDRDAQNLPGYYRAIETAAGRLRQLALKAPPNIGGGVRAGLSAARQLWPMAGLSAEDKRDIIGLFTKSAAAYLDQWFDSDPVKAAFGFDAVVGNYDSPMSAGSAYVLLHHVFGEVNGKKGAWGHVLGGMGRITELMAEACIEAGVEISLEASVSRVLVNKGKATGVLLETGEEVAARRVISNVGPKILYDRLVEANDLPADFRRLVRGYRTGSGTFRMNVALSELPKFSCLPEDGAHLRSGIVIAPSLDYMDRAFIEAKVHGWSRKPVVEMLIPSTVDPTLAPEGQHVASLFCQQFAPSLPDGRSWDKEEDLAAETIIETVDALAPGFRKSILGMSKLSPLGLEQKLGLADGDIMHGAMSLDQLWANRPFPGYAAYQAPLDGLYLCGAGAHPGGGVTGAPGHNAAHAILKGR